MERLHYLVLLFSLLLYYLLLSYRSLLYFACIDKMLKVKRLKKFNSKILYCYFSNSKNRKRKFLNKMIKVNNFRALKKKLPRREN